MVKSKEEILESIKSLIGETIDETTISIIEDLSDTLASVEEASSSSGEWEKKYNELAQKYLDRFFNPETTEETTESGEEAIEEEETEATVEIEDLFEEG